MEENKIIGILVSLQENYVSLRHEMKAGFANNEKRFDELDENISEIKASTSVLDTVLEKHPIERIDRLEKHLNFPRFVVATAEE